MSSLLCLQGGGGKVCEAGDGGREMVDQGQRNFVESGDGAGLAERGIEAPGVKARSFSAVVLFCSLHAYETREATNSSLDPPSCLVFEKFQTC